MISLSKIIKTEYLMTNLFFQARYKSKTHWSVLKKKTSSKYKARNHFNDFYGSIFGEKWKPMRHAMLSGSKYVALVNNYGDSDEVMKTLTDRGAHCLKKLISIQKEFNKQFNLEPDETKNNNNSDRLHQYASKLETDEISNLYPQDSEAPQRVSVGDLTLGEKEKKPEKLQEKFRTLHESLKEATIDQSRIIDPSMGLASETLYQFVPATKLKGMEDWVPESLHYSYYSKERDFPLAIDTESEIVYPEHLKVFTYEMDSEKVAFPEPTRCTTGVYDYYPLDGGSVIAVLALGIEPGDRVLDLCSAPGGKSLVALQTLLPDILVCNDSSISRVNRMKRIFKDYLIDFESSNKWRERVLITHCDARMFSDNDGFDKVLVDVPCTTDRHSMNVDENNIFRPDRIKERLRIPELQSELLVSALRLAKVGGTVLYSTCSLSPIQNDGVVHMALRKLFQEHQIVTNIKDLTPAMRSLSSTMNIFTGEGAPKYGQLVMPSLEANFGPTYFCKIVRIR